MTPDDLSALLHLNRDTGELFWKERPIKMFTGTDTNKLRAWKTWNSRFSGCLISSNSRGYVKLSIFGKALKAHRVVFAIVHGYWPNGEIDHINGIKSDNRPENLREVSHIENSRNQKVRANSPLGVHGISIDRRTGKFIVQINDRGKKRHIGQYTDKSHALIARSAAEKALNYHKNHGRV